MQKSAVRNKGRTPVYSSSNRTQRSTNQHCWVQLEEEHTVHRLARNSNWLPPFPSANSPRTHLGKREIPDFPNFLLEKCQGNISQWGLPFLHNNSSPLWHGLERSAALWNLRCVSCCCWLSSLPMQPKWEDKKKAYISLYRARNSFSHEIVP